MGYDRLVKERTDRESEICWAYKVCELLFCGFVKKIVSNRVILYINSVGKY